MRLGRRRARWNDDLPGNRYSYRDEDGKFELLWNPPILVPYAIAKEMLETSKIWAAAWGEGPQAVPAADVSFKWNETIFVVAGTLT